MDFKQLEAITKAIVPVFKDVLNDAIKSLKSSFDAEIKACKETIDALQSQLKKQQDSAVDLNIEEIIQTVSKSIPVPQDGKNGVDGKSVTVEEIASYFERRFSDLTLSWERQAKETFDKAVDKMPIPKDGKDAFSIDDFDISLGEDGRTITVKMMANDIIKEKSIKIPAVIDRGVFIPDENYEKGDGVTYGGSFWIAQKDNPEGAPSASPDFRLAVKRGRDGKDLRDSSITIDVSKGIKIKGDK